MFFFQLAISAFLASAQVGTATDAMGGAGLGAIQPFEAPLMNPAALGAWSSVFGGLQTYSGPVTGASDLKQHSAILIDANPDTLFPGALVYRYRDYDLAGTEQIEQVFRAAAAYRLTPRIAFGAAAYHIKTDSPPFRDVVQNNGDLYFLWNVSDRLNIGGAARAILGSKDYQRIPEKVLPSAGIGAEYTALSFLKLRGDLNFLHEANPDNHFQHNVGVEIRHLDYVALRVGINGDDMRGETRLTAGFAWEGPKLKAGYAYQKEERKNLGESHTVDIWFNF